MFRYGIAIKEGNNNGYGYFKCKINGRYICECESQTKVILTKFEIYELILITNPFVEIV